MDALDTFDGFDYLGDMEGLIMGVRVLDNRMLLIILTVWSDSLYAMDIFGSFLPIENFVRLDGWYGTLDGLDQVVARRCRLFWLTNRALVYEPKEGGRGGELRGLSL